MHSKFQIFLQACRAPLGIHGVKYLQYESDLSENSNKLELILVNGDI